MNLKMVIRIIAIISIIALFIVAQKHLSKRLNSADKGIKMTKPFNHSIEIEVSEKQTEIFWYTLIPRMKYGQKNNAQLSLKGCFQSNRSHIVNISNALFLTNFVPIYEESYKTERLIYNNRTPTVKEFKARLSELLHTLQSNLNHPHVEQIFVFLEKESTLRYLHSLKLQNSQKLVLHLENKTVSLQTYFEYASKCLLGKLIMIGHQDILFGKGWDQIPYKYMKEKRIMYAITRQPATTSCYYSRESPNCDERHQKYLGSHDVFMFYVRKNTFTSNILRLMNFKQYLNGIENVLIWIFKKKLNYTVSNPCLLLLAHHQHCVPIRDKMRPRINNASTTGLVPFTDTLM
ncbi:uncharacterized protein LOC130622917 [Hydractinia symbiolongicarpus]|uniref:uncharacterized protein LOC130622917 n=1 Tax=Hydractinia symbiolongicarpus TaxID=13093 RepID=UPI00254B0DC3|nr:uncharacterized protein LOC130622917 [Hydractinia symbiolongicarpus]